MFLSPPALSKSFPGTLVRDNQHGITVCFDVTRLGKFCFSCFEMVPAASSPTEPVHCPACNTMQHFYVQCRHPDCSGVFFSTVTLGLHPEKVNPRDWVCSEAHAAHVYTTRLEIYTEAGAYVPSHVEEDLDIFVALSSGRSIVDGLIESSADFLGDDPLDKYVVCVDQRRRPGGQSLVLPLDECYLRALGGFPSLVMLICKDEEQHEAMDIDQDEVPETCGCSPHSHLAHPAFFAAHGPSAAGPSVGVVDPVARKSKDDRWWVISCFDIVEPGPAFIDPVDGEDLNEEPLDFSGLKHVSAVRKGRSNRTSKRYVATETDSVEEANRLVDHIIDNKYVRQGRQLEYLVFLQLYELKRK